jgi:hypothetical protein
VIDEHSCEVVGVLSYCLTVLALFCKSERQNMPSDFEQTNKSHFKDSKEQIWLNK